MPDQKRATCRTLFALSFCAVLSATASARSAETLHLVTEAYPPFAYEEGGATKGVVTDLLKAVMADAKIDYDIRILPWARAYTLASTEKNYCAFSTVHTTERDAHFQWVEPLFLGEAYLVRKAGTPVNPATLMEARPFRVGTQLGDYTIGILQSQGFTRIDLAAEIELTLKKLLGGRIDMMPMEKSMIKDLQKKQIPIEPVVKLVTNVESLACNPNTSPVLIKRMAESLKVISTNGTRDAIFAKYDFKDGAMMPAEGAREEQ